MSEPTFKSNWKPLELPATVYAYNKQDIQLPIEMAPYINVNLITKNGDPGANLALYPNVEVPTWIDYWRIYGDDELLYQAQLSGVIYDDSDPDWVWKMTRIYNASDLWRVKYYNDYGTYYIPTYMPNYTGIGFLQTKTDGSDKFFYEDIEPRRHSLPSGYTPDSYPIYNVISMTRNVPDAEYTPSVEREFNLGYTTPAFVQIIGEQADLSKFKIIADGTYYKTCQTELAYTLTMPCMTREFQLVVEDTGELDIYGDPKLWWYYTPVSKTEWTTEKYFYRPIKTQEDYQFLISMDSHKIKTKTSMNKRIK